LWDYLKEEKKINEIIGVLVCFLAIILLLSILSFNIVDYTSQAGLPDYEYKNLMGVFGANIAEAIFTVFGKSSYLIPIFFIIWGVFEFKDKRIAEHLIVKLIAIFFIIIAFSAIFEIIIPESANKEIRRELVAGGFIGILFFKIKHYIGFGVYLLVLALLSFSVVLLTKLSFIEGALFIWKYLAIGFLKFINFLKIIGLKFLEKIWSGIKKIFIALKESFKNYKDKNELKKQQETTKNIENLKVKITKKEEETNKPAKTLKEQLQEKIGVSIKEKKEENEQKIAAVKDEDDDNDKSYKISVEQAIAKELEEREDIIARKKQQEQSSETEDIKESADDDEPEEIAVAEIQKNNYSAEIYEDEEEQPEEFIIQKKEIAHTNEVDVEEALSNMTAKKELPPFELPPIELLNRPANTTYFVPEEEIRDIISKLEDTFDAFKIDAKVTDYNVGPTVTMYEVLPAPGVPVNKIATRHDDIKLQLAAKSIRIVAPIPGKSAVGIEIPNKKAALVSLRELIESDEFVKNEAPLKMAIGKDILGKPVIANLAKMPHLLVAGATGSGKSVCMNTIIISLIMKLSPDQLKLILIDPKMVEFKPYSELPHLIAPVVTDMKKAARAFNWAIKEMTERYQKLQKIGARDILRYNAMSDEKLPFLVIIVDELADLMALARKDCEAAISRLAAMARAVGIHLILATQRPSVDVVTGLIKANFPSRIAFQVSSSVDSRTILDQIGAESLLGNGDMLYKPQAFPKPVRVQGAYVSDEEIERVINFIQSQRKFEYSQEEDMFNIDTEENDETENDEYDASENSGEDELLEEAERIVVLSRQGSVALLQRKLRVGHNRAVKLMNLLEKKGVVGPSMGPQPRQILIAKEDYLRQKGWSADSEQAKIY